MESKEHSHFSLPFLSSAAPKLVDERWSSVSAQSTQEGSNADTLLSLGTLSLLSGSSRRCLSKASVKEAVAEEQVLPDQKPEVTEVRAPAAQRPEGHFQRAAKLLSREISNDCISVPRVRDAIKRLDASYKVACFSNSNKRVIEDLPNLMETTSEEVRSLTEDGTVFMLVERSETCLSMVVEVLKRYSSPHGAIVLPVLMERFTGANHAAMYKRIAILVQSGADDVVILPSSEAELSLTISSSLGKAMAHRSVTSNLERKLRTSTKQCEQLFWQVAHEIMADFPEEQQRIVEVPGKRVGNIDLGRKLGEGSFGAVYQGNDKDSGTSCVVKVIAKGRFRSHHELEKVVTEYSILRKVSHANLLSGSNLVHGVRNLYLIMEYAGAGTLFKTMEREGKGGMPWTRTKSFFSQIVAGVAHLHESQIAHCDLKPENVVLSEDGAAKLVDFGQAIEVAQGIPELTSPPGTVPFIAPEIMRLSPEWDPIACDLWQAGVILFEMLSGNNSFVQLMGWERRDFSTTTQLAERAADIAARFDEANKAGILADMAKLCKSSPPSCAMELLAQLLELAPSRRLLARDVASQLVSKS